MSASARGILSLSVLLLLVAGCGSAGPTAMPTMPTLPPAPAQALVSPTDTPVPVPATATSVPPAASLVPTATTLPAPTSTATAKAPTLAPSPEPLAKPGVKTFGGPESDIAYSIRLTADGGALIAGSANNSQVHGHGALQGNARLIKTDLEGDMIWEKDYGGEVSAAFFSMIQAARGKYVLLGDTSSPEASDRTDLYLIEVDEEGNKVWSHTYGSSGNELGRSVQQTAEGGYILIGSTTSSPDTYASIYLVKTDAQGNEVWSRAYGDQWLHMGWDVAQMPDGGYILTGFTAPDHDARDILAMKLSAGGDVEWSRSWDFGGLDEGFAITLAPDGNVVLVGVASLGSPESNIVLLKVDPQGNEIWNKTVGQAGAAAWHITAMPEGDRPGRAYRLQRLDAQDRRGGRGSMAARFWHRRIRRCLCRSGRSAARWRLCLCRRCHPSRRTESGHAVVETNARPRILGGVARNR